MEKTPVILTVNCGSSSLKFGLFSHANPPANLLTGQIRDIGEEEGRISIGDAAGKELHNDSASAGTMEEAVHVVIGLLGKHFGNYDIQVIGHRLVQGGIAHFEPALVTDELLTALEAFTPLAPGHLPAELSAIRAFRSVFPTARQIACFDTAFHQHMPFPARHYALPRALWKEGLIRYGFHGLSYEYIMQQLPPGTAQGRIIIAHLGNGASMAAIRNGASIDTTMGLTPAGGLVMSTRPGDMDPGVVLYLMKEKKMGADVLNQLLNKLSGLKAISGHESNIRELLEAAPTDQHAAEAVDMFCYQAKKFIGALAAALGGLDTLVFTGGIGEHAPAIRERICEGLAFLGIEVDTTLNETNREIISPAASNVTIRVIPTNEEQIIAQHARQWLHAH